MNEVIDDRELRRTLAVNIPRLRQEAGMSQQRLADEVGVSRITINRIENGRLTPGSDLLYSLADALGVATDALRQLSAPAKKIG